MITGSVGARCLLRGDAFCPFGKMKVAVVATKSTQAMSMTGIAVTFKMLTCYEILVWVAVDPWKLRFARRSKERNGLALPSSMPSL